MAAGNNTFLYFTTLGGATAPAGRIITIGSFTLDVSTGINITITEGAGSGEDDIYNDGNGGGGTNITSDQIISGGIYNGMESGVISRVEVTNGLGQVVGKIYEITADQDGDGDTHENAEIIGYVLAGSFVDGETYTASSSFAPHETPAGATYADLLCFVSGTLIRTQTGEHPIEDLTSGDMVLTMDHGYQPIRWIWSSTRAATGDLAPILIRKGALGNDRDLRVSPQHRMLLQGWQAELLFGESEVLATAKSLINDHSIIRVEGGEVEYYHMLFDTHEIVWAEGAPSESFHPGEQGWNSFDQATRDEILELFPQLGDKNFESYGPSARLSLKHKEGVLLGEHMVDKLKMKTSH